MATSPYFNHYYAFNEQDLIEKLVIESIKIQGMDIVYIPRSQENIDVIFNEDSNNTFDSFECIEMYPASTEGFDGDQLMTVFGNEFKKSATFVVSKRRFKEVFPEMVRPREGDLLFMPITNAVLEIRFVNTESPFFEKGKQYVYELRVEAFEYSYEDISTGNHEIDDILEHLKVEDPETNTEPFGKNNEIAEDSGDDIVYDPSNPFGIR